MSELSDCCLFSAPDTGLASNDDHNINYLPAALRAAQICRYLVYSEADFEVFRPAGATRCTGVTTRV